MPDAQNAGQGIVVNVDVQDVGAVVKAAITAAAVDQVEAIVKGFDFEAAVKAQVEAKIHSMIGDEIESRIPPGVAEQVKALVEAVVASPAHGAPMPAEPAEAAS